MGESVRVRARRGVFRVHAERVLRTGRDSISR